MKQRSDMAYWTLLSFSLSMVLTMQHGRAEEEASVFKSARLRGQQICLLKVQDIQEAFRVLAAQDTSFVFEHRSLAAGTVDTSLKDVLEALYCCPSAPLIVGSAFTSHEDFSDQLLCDAGLGGGESDFWTSQTALLCAAPESGHASSVLWSVRPSRAGPAYIA